VADKERGRTDEGQERPAPFGGKLDEYVGKVIPARFMATAFVGAAAAALLFFVLTIVGFARSPEESASAQRDAAQKKYDDERAKHAETQKALRDAMAARKDVERKAEQLESQLKRAAGEKDSAEAAQKKAESALAEERAKHAETQKALREAQRVRKEAEEKAASAEVQIARVRSDKDAVENARKALETQLADLRKQFNDLQKKTDEQARIQERAQAAFDGIVKTVSEIRDAAKKVETMERLREGSYGDLAGTPLLARLDGMIAYEKRRLEEQKAAAEKKAVRDVKATFDDAMKRAAAAASHDSAIEILQDAKQKLAGTVQESAIDKEIQRRNAANKEAVAKSAYDAVIARVKKSPSAYEENIAAAEEALPKTEGTRYNELLQAKLAQLRAEQKEYNARSAYEGVLARVKRSPDAHDENIAAAEEALPKTKGTRYEALLQAQLKGLREQRLDAIGRAALEAAKAQLAKSPKEYAANVAALKELKAKAAGSPHEAAIEAMLRKQEALAARAAK